MSIQIFHICRIYQANHGDLICSLCSCTERFPFLFLSHTAPGAQLWFWPHLCVCATLKHLFPAERETKQQLIGAHLLTQAREGYSGPTGVCMKVEETSRELQQTGLHSLWWESLPVPAEAGAGMWGWWQPCPSHTTQQWCLLS